jgi:hypothetical protein
MLVSNAIKILQRYGTVSYLPPALPSPFSNNALAFAMVNGNEVGFHTWRLGNGPAYARDPYVIRDVALKIHRGVYRPCRTLTVALRLALERSRFVFCGDGSASARLFGARFFHAGSGLKPVAEFFLGGRYFTDRRPGAPGMVESWLREEIPAGALLDWLKESPDLLVADLAENVFLD